MEFFKLHKLQKIPNSSIGSNNSVICWSISLVLIELLKNTLQLIFGKIIFSTHHHTRSLTNELIIVGNLILAVNNVAVWPSGQMKVTFYVLNPLCVELAIIYLNYLSLFQNWLSWQNW